MLPKLWSACLTLPGPSVSIASTSFIRTKLADQPGAGEAPIAFQGGRGDPQYFSGFLFRESGEKAQLDHPGAALIEFPELVEGAVNLEKFLFAWGGWAVHLVQRQAHLAAAALFGAMGAGVVDQDATHLLGGHGEELRPAGWRRPPFFGVCDVPKGHANPFPHTIAARILEHRMPIYHRTYSPGELQFITTSTYRRTPVFFSPRF
jgi:hypothetical protein